MSFEFANRFAKPDAKAAEAVPASGMRIEWNAASERAWNTLFDRARYGAYQQHYAYGAVISKLGGAVNRAVIYDGAAPIALAQVQSRRFFGLATLATIMRGPVWLEPNIDDDIKVDGYRLLKRTLPVGGIKAFLLMPESDDGAAEKRAGLIRAVSPYHTVFVDLSADEGALRAAMDGKWRNRLRAAEKANISINQVGRKPTNYAWLLEKEVEQQGRAGYNALPPAFTTLFHEAAGVSSVFALEAKTGAERIGGVLFLRHGQGATYHIGWSSEAGKAANVHNLLLWRAMLALKAKGVGVLDLGGLDTNQRPGIARFKLGVGGKLFSQSGAYCLSPSRL